VGQRVMPRRYDPLADAVPDDRLGEHLQMLRRGVRAAARSMPDHRQFIERYCPAQSMPPAVRNSSGA
jgi:tryptophan halogenase